MSPKCNTLCLFFTKKGIIKILDIMEIQKIYAFNASQVSSLNLQLADRFFALFVLLLVNLFAFSPYTAYY
jgi:hypothetical protein